MAIEPIRGRCRHCGERLLLAEVVAAASGRCPYCGELLAPGYTFLLLEEAQRAEMLQRQLILSLGRLRGLPGNLSLTMEGLVRSALADIDPKEQLSEDRDMIRQQAAQIGPRTGAWRRLPGLDRRRHARGLAASIHSLAQRLRRHADQLEQGAARHAGSPEPNSTALRAVADLVDTSADAVAEDRRLSDDIVRDAMAAVEDTLRDNSVERAG